MIRSSVIFMVVLTGCQGLIDARSPAITPVTPETPTFIKRCSTPGLGSAAQMRLLWSSAYLGELTTILGPGAASAATALGLSPATSKSFGFDSAGSVVTDLALDSMNVAADAVAVWALSSDANAQAVFGCNARTVTGDDATACFTAFLKSKGQRLVRRSWSDDEIADNVAFFQSQIAEGTGPDAQEGFRQGLASLLVHPDFVYLRDAPVGQTNVLAPFSIASRISFGLTGHGPDDALFAAALDGSLADPKVIKAQVDRLLLTDDAKQHVQLFYRQWLGYAPGVNAYSTAFLDGLDPTGVRDDASAELDAFTADQTWNVNAPPSALLTSRSTAPLSKALAAVYGAKAGDTELPANRAGVLTRVGLLATGNDDWHVVARGLTVVQRMLCKTIGQPTVDVAAALKQAESLKVSNVDRMNTVTSSAQCQACHSTINPLGDARSDFDAIGRSVTVEKHFTGGVLDYQVPVVSKSDLSGPLGHAASANGSVDLSNFIAAGPEFGACFSQQYVRHVMGRDSSSDACLADDGARSTFNGGTILDAMRAITSSSEFVLWRDQ